MVSVIFPAAGQGKRMKAGMNKVFLELAGKPILVQTLLKFSAVPEVSELIVVVGADEISSISAMLATVSGLKPYKIVAGGSERQYSVWNGLKATNEENEVVLVHDAARPLVSIKTIKDVIAVAKKGLGAVAAVPEKNTIKVVDATNTVVKTPDRSTLWAIQTPQGFLRKILWEANEKAEETGFLGTDDASLVERLPIPVQVVLADYQNIKITTPEDLIMAEAFFKLADSDLTDQVKQAATKAKQQLLGETKKV